MFGCSHFGASQVLREGVLLAAFAAMGKASICFQMLDLLKSVFY